MSPRLLIPLAAVTLMLAGCSRDYARYTYYQTNVSESQLDAHLKELDDTSGVKTIHETHDSSNKVTLQLEIDADSPYEAKETLRKLGYTQVRD